MEWVVISPYDKIITANLLETIIFKKPLIKIIKGNNYYSLDPNVDFASPSFQTNLYYSH